MYTGAYMQVRVACACSIPLPDPLPNGCNFCGVRVGPHYEWVPDLQEYKRQRELAKAWHELRKGKRATGPEGQWVLHGERVPENKRRRLVHTATHHPPALPEPRIEIMAGAYILREGMATTSGSRISKRQRGAGGDSRLGAVGAHIRHKRIQTGIRC